MTLPFTRGSTIKFLPVIFEEFDNGFSLNYVQCFIIGSITAQKFQIKSARDHLHVLIDIVSKNGILLLNISPMADGTIPGDQQQVLLEMGTWLELYGEAIYKTRPWDTFGEGPTQEPEGSHPGSAFNEIKYSSSWITLLIGIIVISGGSFVFFTSNVKYLSSFPPTPSSRDRYTEYSPI